MRSIGIVVWLCGWSSLIMAQGLVDTTFVLGKKSISGYFYGEVDNPKTMLIGLRGADEEKWNAKSWGQELIPYAEKNQWALFVPSEVNPMHLEVLVQSIASDSNAMKALFLSNGAGIEPTKRMLQIGVGGLMIFPDSTANLGEIPSKLPIAIVDNRNQTWKHTDSLLLDGHWVNEKLIEKVDQYYSDNYYEEYDRLLVWVDSLQQFFADSLAFATWSSNEGLQNQLPEVVRQGQTLELVIHLAAPKELHIDLLDLSANSVWSETTFFGAGKHKLSIPTKALNWGVYSLELKGEGIINRSKTMIRG